MKNYSLIFRLFLLFLFAFAVSRIFFIVYNSSLFNAPFHKIFIQSWWHGLRMDISAAGYCIAPILLLSLLQSIFLFNISIRYIRIYIVVVLALIGLITIVDAELYSHWGNKFNSQILVYISHPKEMAAASGAIPTGKVIIGIISLVVANWLIYKFLIKKYLWNINSVNRKSIPFFLMLITIVFIGIRGGLGVATISQSDAYYSNENIENQAAVNSLWNALYYIANNSDKLYSDKFNYFTKDEAELILEQQLASSPDSLNWFAKPKPNIVLIMLESFTASASKLLTGSNNCTPYLDKLAKENYYFNNCYASGDRTEKGLVALLSGYPAQPLSSIIVFPDKMQKLPSISKSLKNIGYKNYFFYGGDCDFASMKSYLLAHKFDEIIDKSAFTSDEQNSKWGAHDGNLYNKVLEKLNTLKTPFFTTIMTLSSHEPFEVPFKSESIVQDEWYPYKNSIMYADKMLYDFIERCKNTSWYNETIFVLIADHGHDIGVPNLEYFGKEKYHIPFVLLGGALQDTLKGKINNTVVSQTIVPHILLNNLQVSTTDFSWQTDLSATKPFAQYHFNNGWGRVGTNYNYIFDNNLQKCVSYKGDSSYHFIKEGQAFQQCLINDFLTK